jgi:hypothetical protein
MSNEKTAPNTKSPLAQFVARVRGKVPAPILGLGAARKGGNGYPKGFLVWENSRGFRTLVDVRWIGARGKDSNKAVTTFPGTLVDDTDIWVTGRSDRGRLVGSVALDTDTLVQHLDEMYTDTRPLPPASRTARVSEDARALLSDWDTEDASQDAV